MVHDEIVGPLNYRQSFFNKSHYSCFCLNQLVFNMVSTSFKINDIIPLTLLSLFNCAVCRRTLFCIVVFKRNMI